MSSPGFLLEPLLRRDCECLPRLGRYRYSDAPKDRLWRLSSVSAVRKEVNVTLRESFSVGQTTQNVRDRLSEVPQTGNKASVVQAESQARGARGGGTGESDIEVRRYLCTFFLVPLGTPRHQGYGDR